jgi:hypothetical protein|tara:strand:+ start:73 stop:315 length:243 start_codon:yes stop_codon:yes gene_type:complete
MINIIQIIIKYGFYLFIHAIVLLICQYFIQDDFNNYIQNYRFEEMDLIEGITIDEIVLHLTLGPIWTFIVFNSLFRAIKY